MNKDKPMKEAGFVDKYVLTNPVTLYRIQLNALRIKIFENENKFKE